MPRLVVCGCPGSGKSTYAGKLAALLGLPVIALDAHFWQPGWVPMPREAFRARMAPMIAGENWIIDGNYLDALEGQHLTRATHIVFFDLPRWRCLVGAFLRILKHRGKTRPGMAADCPERFDPAFFGYIWSFRQKQRPRLAEAFRAMAPAQVRRVFHTHAEAEEWLGRLSREGLP